MLIEIVIDTNGKNYDEKLYSWNEKLWNLIVPNIKYLKTSEGLQPSSEIDWKRTKSYFENSNGHCIIQKESQLYKAAYEYESLYFEEDFLDKMCNFTYPFQPLSYLLAEIAIKHNIEWSYVNKYKEL